MMGGVKTQFSLLIILAGALLAFITADATTPRSGPAALAGTWTNSLGTIWAITAEGTFYFIRPKPNPQIWGTCTVAGDIVTIHETRRVPRGVIPGYNGPVPGSEPIPKDCNGNGVYKFTRVSENTLTFMLVNDTCSERKKNVLLAWHRK